MQFNVEFRVDLPKTNPDLAKSYLQRHVATRKKKALDSWSDKKRRSICNFLVNSPKGTIFLYSIDTSDISKTAEKVCQMLDEVVDRVGEENVVQLVTDNAANYKLAGEMLMQKRKCLFWTPCAARCLDLMLEDFENKRLRTISTQLQRGRRLQRTYILELCF